MKKQLKELEKNENGLLALVWRRLIFDTKQYNLLKYYLDTYKRRGGKKNKNSIQQLFISGNLTWKSFLFLIFQILPIKKMKVTFEFEFLDKQKYSTSIEVEPSLIKEKEVEDELKKIKEIEELEEKRKELLSKEKKEEDKTNT